MDVGSYRALARVVFLAAGLVQSSFALSLADSLSSRRTVSVLDLQLNGEGMGSLGIEAGGAIGARLLAMDRFQVVERSQVQKILSEQGFQESGACDGSDCQVQVGKVLGVDWILTGSIGQIPGGYSTNLRLLEVATGRVLYQKHDVYQGDIVKYLSERVPTLGEDVFRGRPERILADSVLEMKEGDVRAANAAIFPSIAPQGVRLTGFDGQILVSNGALQMKSLRPGNIDLVLVAEADSSVRRTLHVRVFPDEEMARRRRNFRIRWLGSAGSAAVAVAGGVLGYMNNTALKSAQADYDVALTRDDISAARTRMDQKIQLRNLGYAAGLTGLAGIATFQLVF